MRHISLLITKLTMITSNNYIMRRFFTSLPNEFITSSLLFAQTQVQNGVVKTRRRMVNGKYVRGQGLPGAIVTIQGRGNFVVQNNAGTFSFLVSSQQFSIISVNHINVKWRVSYSRNLN